MVDIEKIKTQIIEKLAPLKPDKVILFGSYAMGKSAEDSDIDLYVVTADDFMPANWNEKNEIYLKISRQIRSLRNDIPVDLIVHTREMNRKFFELNSSFARDIQDNGISLL